VLHLLLDALKSEFPVNTSIAASDGESFTPTLRAAEVLEKPKPARVGAIWENKKGEGP
jgi:hypothetical protein